MQISLTRIANKSLWFACFRQRGKERQREKEREGEREEEAKKGSAKFFCFLFALVFAALARYSPLFCLIHFKLTLAYSYLINRWLFIKINLAAQSISFFNYTCTWGFRIHLCYKRLHVITCDMRQVHVLLVCD